MPSNRTPKGEQVDTIDRYSEHVQESFDLERFDDFTTSLGVEFVHFKAMISPIGKKDRGDYRRSDGVDTITSNGMIYRLAGRFTATMTDNSRSKRRGDSGTLDPSESRLVLPRFYNDKGVSDGKRIYLAPGDRIYVADPLADVFVSNYQEVDYEPGVDNVPMFSIAEMEQPIIDSRNAEYQQGADFDITPQGNIVWISGGKNPGIDPDTGKGRIYSIRYLYKAFWYITALPKEIRITNVTTDGERKPERMPYHAMVVREYVFHQRNRGEQSNQLKPKDQARTGKAPVEPINPGKYPIKVDMTAIDDGEQS